MSRKDLTDDERKVLLMAAGIRFEIIEDVDGDDNFVCIRIRMGNRQAIQRGLEQQGKSFPFRADGPDAQAQIASFIYSAHARAEEVRK